MWDHLGSQLVKMVSNLTLYLPANPLSSTHASTPHARRLTILSLSLPIERMRLAGSVIKAEAGLVFKSSRRE